MIDTTLKHQRLAGDTYLVVLLAGTIAMGVFGSLFSLFGLQLHLPVGLSATLCCAFSGLLAGLGLLALIHKNLIWRVGISVLLAGFALYMLAESQGLIAPRVDAESVMQSSVPALMFLLIAISLGFGIEGVARRTLFRLMGNGVFLVGLSSLLLDWMPEQHGVLGELQRTGASLASSFLLFFGLAMHYLADRWRSLPLAISRRHRDVAVIGVTLSVLGFLLVGWQQHRAEAEQAEHVADVVELTSESVISRHEQAMQRMAERWRAMGGMPTLLLRKKEIDSYLRDHPALKGIAFISDLENKFWHRSQDGQTQSQMQVWLEDNAAKTRLASEGSSPQWRFLDPEAPLNALIVTLIPGSNSGRLIGFVDVEELLVEQLHLELGGYAMHLEQGGATVLEVASASHDHSGGAQALKPLASRQVDFSGANPLSIVLFGGPPAPWSGSALLSTGVGAGSLFLSYLLAFSFGVMRLSQGRAKQLDQTNQRLQLQYRAQSQIARESSIEKSLEAVCRMLEQQLPGAFCSVMLCDEAQTQFDEVIGPSLPDDYLKALVGLEIGSGIGACGSAAYSQELVVCEDLSTDPRWKGYQELARHHDLASCWSFPLLASSGQVLGTLALYQSEPGTPGDEERQLAFKAVGLIVLAIERFRDRQALIDSENRYRSLFTHHPDAVFSVDLDGKFLSLNPQTTRITGLPASEMLGKHFAHFVESADVPQGQALFESARSGHALRYELQNRDAHGVRHVLDITAIPMMTGDHVNGVFGIAKDITARKRDETQLRILERSLEASINGVVIVDATLPDMPIIFANHAFSNITGYTNDEIKGRNCRFLQGPDTDPEAIEKVRRALAAEQDVQVTLCNYGRNGERFWNDLHISPVRDDHGVVTHHIGVINDVSKRIADDAALAHQASHDGLTDAYNRAVFEERLQHEAGLARQENRLVVVLFIDLDDFKPINDTFGHAMGDRLLVAVADRLNGALRPGDTLGRFGGDEFLVLLTNLEHERQVQSIADRLLAAITRPYHVEDHAFRLSASIGMASSREVLMQHPEQLILRADSAMYAAKKQGGNTAQWYHHQSGEVAPGRVELRKDIQEAIELEQFSLHYQPLMSYDGDVKGFEALIRWHHPSKGLISPGTFIPVAEITGQIVPISEWVLAQVCRDLPALRKLGDQDCRVAINLSPMQFQRPNFLSNLEQQLRESDIPAEWLEVEVTEGVLMEDQEVAISVLEALRHLGVGVAIDDFGTGFSSLSYLKQLPVTKVKIDRSFIRDIAVDESDRAIVLGILSMAHQMGLEVVTEGVETEDQLQYLADSGCDIFQGYLLAKPMSMEKLEPFLARTPEF
ncbi:bifunctional diguanylate cyclase/phosphodiesterase [Halomonas salinarum]|uniref:bifunctional diguanylate cyclase/phosphodiesterase n=1 Tax=Halomonas salinarum TaxID=1158993 RepID=UPI00143C1FC6|nr:EAL domain-containing protein [Halomonas salinarum]